MKGFIEFEENERSIFRLFGRYPWKLMVVAVLGMYAYGLVSNGDMTDPAGMEGMANAFFRGVIVSVGLYYLSRIMAMSALKKTVVLTERDAEGVFIPCLSHKNWYDMSSGCIIVMEDRLYFESTKPFGGDRTFDYNEFEGFQFALSKPYESLALYIITGERYMMTVENSKGERVGRFIMPEPEKHLPTIQALLK